MTKDADQHRLVRAELLDEGRKFATECRVAVVLQRTMRQRESTGGAGAVVVRVDAQQLSGARAATPGRFLRTGSVVASGCHIGARRRRGSRFRHRRVDELIDLCAGRTNFGIRFVERHVRVTPRGRGRV